MGNVLRFLINDLLRVFSAKSIASVLPIIGPFLVAILNLFGNIGKYVPFFGNIITSVINGPAGRC